jgi:YgiT-type zinc finger domain-containing protein
MKRENTMPPLNTHEQPGEPPCNECPAGVMHLRHITYFTWLSGELITVPDFPAWVCDICGKREYDGRSITWLNMLLNPETGHAARRTKRPSRPDSRKRNLPPPLREDPLR